MLYKYQQQIHVEAPKLVTSIIFTTNPIFWTKCILNPLKVGLPGGVDPVLRFMVKFYMPDPSQLEEEYTRW